MLTALEIITELVSSRGTIISKRREQFALLEPLLEEFADSLAEQILEPEVVPSALRAFAQDNRLSFSRVAAMSAISQ